MDDSTTIKELKEKYREFTEKRDWDQFHGAKELAVAASVEAAELLEHFLWKTPEDVEAMFKDEKKREEIEHELVDTMSYLILLAERYDIDISEVANKQLEKNDKKYPVEKAKGKSDRYHEL